MIGMVTPSISIGRSLIIPSSLVDVLIAETIKLEEAFSILKPNYLTTLCVIMLTAALLSIIA